MATPETKTDAELVAQALSGSTDAYHDLVRRFEKPILSLIVRMVRDPALAEDLAQEAFVKAFRNLRKYDPQRKLASWLFKIAHNTTLDHLRRHRVETVPLEATTSQGETTEQWEVLAAPVEEEPDQLAERSETARAVERAMERLKPQYRAILQLRFQEELAYDEIAEVMGLAMGTVKIQIHRARKRLAAELLAMGFAPSGSSSRREKKKADAGETRNEREA